MSRLENWFNERLKQLSEADFVTVPHRRTPDPLKKDAHVHYYSVPLASGVATSVLIVPRDESVRKDAFILLFHGLGDDSTYPHWHWIEALVKKGFSVFSVDWDGHGVGNSSHLDLQMASRSLPLILQKLFGQAGAPLLSASDDRPKCFLMGHSAGGALILIAATRPDVANLVEGVVVVSPAVALSNSQKFRREAFSYLKPSTWWRDLWSKIPYYGLFGLVPAFGNFKRSQFPIRLRVGIDYVEQMRAFVRETFEVRRVLRHVKVPVLWLHGCKDSVVPAESAGALMSEIPSGLFCHMENNRNHLRMAFSTQVPQYVARFVETYWSALK